MTNATTLTAATTTATAWNKPGGLEAMGAEAAAQAAAMHANLLKLGGRSIDGGLSDSELAIIAQLVEMQISTASKEILEQALMEAQGPYGWLESAYTAFFPKGKSLGQITDEVVRQVRKVDPKFRLDIEEGHPAEDWIYSIGQEGANLSSLELQRALSELPKLMRKPQHWELGHEEVTEPAGSADGCPRLGESTGEEVLSWLTAELPASVGTPSEAAQCWKARLRALVGTVDGAARKAYAAAALYHLLSEASYRGIEIAQAIRACWGNAKLVPSLRLMDSAAGWAEQWEELAKLLEGLEPSAQRQISWLAMTREHTWGTLEQQTRFWLQANPGHEAEIQRGLTAWIRVAGMCGEAGHVPAELRHPLGIRLHWE